MYAPPSLAHPSIDVTIEVPTGSRLHGTANVCRFLVTGELGQCELKTSVGDLQLEKAGPLELQTSGGNITVDQVVSRANITTGTGTVRIREIDGSAVVKNSNGDSTIREVAGDLQVNAANGNITVERPRGSVTAKTANGNIRIGDASRGTLRLETSLGELEVGIHPGSAAYLDVNTKARHPAEPDGNRRPAGAERGNRARVRAQLLRQHHHPARHRRLAHRKSASANGRAAPCAARSTARTALRPVPLKRIR